MPQNKPPQHSQTQQTSQQRLVSLTALLSHQSKLKQLTEHEGFAELLTVVKAEGARRRKGAQAINWDSTADEFRAFEKKSLYAAGFIQGVDFAANVLESIPTAYEDTKRSIDELAAQIKEENRQKKRR